jgi:hypothetical protein
VAATEAQHQLEEQMLERCVTDRHAKFVAVGEVVGRFASGRIAWPAALILPLAAEALGHFYLWQSRHLRIFRTVAQP